MENTPRKHPNGTSERGPHQDLKLGKLGLRLFLFGLGTVSKVVPLLSREKTVKLWEAYMSE